MLSASVIIQKSVKNGFSTIEMKKSIKYEGFFARPQCDFDFFKIHFFRYPSKSPSKGMKCSKWGSKFSKSWYIIRDPWILSRILDHFLARASEKTNKNDFLWFLSIFLNFWGLIFVWKYKRKLILFYFFTHNRSDVHL